MEAHRAAVRDATLDAAAALVAERGLTAVTMSEIAQRTGIGRATLYKYFPDVSAVLVTWHERQVSDHLARLTRVRDGDGSAVERLEAVLEEWAGIARERGAQLDGELATLLHQGDKVAQAQQHLRDLVRDLIAKGAANGELRDDIPPEELAAFCLHALTAAASLPSADGVRRLVSLTLAGLRPAG